MTCFVQCVLYVLFCMTLYVAFTLYGLLLCCFSVMFAAKRTHMKVAAAVVKKKRQALLKYS